MVKGDLYFILGFSVGMLHDLEQGINDEPFRGAGYLQLPLMSAGALHTNTPGKIKMLTLVPVCQTLTTLTFW